MSAPRTHFVVGLGGNLGAREASFRASLALLDSTDGVEVEALSPLYDTAPVGPPQPRYLNAAARVAATLAPEALLDRLLAIEAQLGRDRAREERWGPRPLDLDLLWASSGPLRTPRLELPHPRLAERAFALAPLLDVAPPEVARAFAGRLEELGGAPARVMPSTPPTRTVAPGGGLRIHARARDAAEAVALLGLLDADAPPEPSASPVSLASAAGLEGLASPLDALLAAGRRLRWLTIVRVEGASVDAVAGVGPPGEAPPRRVRALAIEADAGGARATLELAGDPP